MTRDVFWLAIALVILSTASSSPGAHFLAGWIYSD